ncbi:MAG: hypothetical protein DMF69_22295 [Acidobacteria bacterium]|nr:MAG: hypothetical protein DMF69_22295 [Acidobacteriota bacterium]
MKGFIMDTTKLKKALSSTGNGLMLAATAIHNTPIRSRLIEIEEEMEKLREEKAELEARLLDA